MKKRKVNKKYRFDVETLKRWKYSSTNAKLEWLESALKLGKLKDS